MAESVEWNLKTAWADYEAGLVDGVSDQYEALLGKCPVVRIPAASISDQGASDYWAVLSYAEVVAAARDPRTFSNVTKEEGPRIIPLQMDPPEHAGYRRLLNPYFSADIITQVEKRSRSYGSKMIQEMVDRGYADFAEEFAFPFPTRVLCTYLGLPEDDWRFHHNWVMDMEEATGNGLLDSPEAVPPELASRIIPRVAELIKVRQAEPGNDVVTGILKGHIDGAPIDQVTTMYMIITLMMAGHITTTSAVGAFVARLATDDSLQQFLRANPDHIPNAVEESLRLDGPQQAMPRKCVRDVTVGGRPSGRATKSP